MKPTIDSSFVLQVLFVELCQDQVKESNMQVIQVWYHKDFKPLLKHTGFYVILIQMIKSTQSEPFFFFFSFFAFLCSGCITGQSTDLHRGVLTPFHHRLIILELRLNSANYVKRETPVV